MYKKFLSLLLAAALAVSALFGCAVPAMAGESGGDCIYFFNTHNGFPSDMILVQSNGHYGLIDASNRESDTIVDENGGTIHVAGEDFLSNPLRYKNGKTMAEYMIDALGVTHLDFILGTHAHSDHIGGVPEIAALEHNGVKLVDSGTVYLCKPYVPADEISGSQWYNGVFAYQAAAAMEEAGAAVAYVSSPQTAADAINGADGLWGAYYSPRSGIDDFIQFYMGDYTIRLYNLYSASERYDENINSIVAVIMKGSQTIVSLADIDIEQGREQAITRAIADDVGPASLVKAAHHGYSCSNSIESADNLRPAYVVKTGNNVIKSDYAAYYGYCQKNFGTTFYSVYDAERGICVEVFDDSLVFYGMSGSGSSVSYRPMPTNTASFTELWARSCLSFEGEGDNDSTMCWVYFSENKLVTGWKYLDNHWFYFRDNGIMATGFLTVNGRTYYLATEGDPGRYFHGQMLTGWQKIDNTWYYFRDSGAMAIGWCLVNDSWYYMDGDGAMQTGWVQPSSERYYLSASGAMVTGWNYIDGSWYYMDKSGAMQTGWRRLGDVWYYLKPDGVMATGWQKVGGTWYYLDRSGAMQTGWLDYNGSWYYLLPSGAMVTGWYQVGDTQYYFNTSGALVE